MYGIHLHLYMLIYSSLYFWYILILMTFLCFQDPSTWFPDVPGKAVGDLPGRTNGLRGEKQQETWIWRGNFPEIWMFSHGVKSHVTNVSEKNLEWVKHLLIKTGRPAETGGGVYLYHKKKRFATRGQVQSGARYVATKPPISTHPQVRGIIHKDVTYTYIYMQICVCPAVSIKMKY